MTIEAYGTILRTMKPSADSLSMEEVVNLSARRSNRSGLIYCATNHCLKVLFWDSKEKILWDSNQRCRFVVARRKAFVATIESSVSAKPKCLFKTCTNKKWHINDKVHDRGSRQTNRDWFWICLPSWRCHAFQKTQVILDLRFMPPKHSFILLKWYPLLKTLRGEKVFEK